MKIVTIVGARPQFIKCAPVSKEIRTWAEEILVHTGQHYDQNMSDVFFSELDIPKPDINLHIGSGNHGAQTGDMLKAIESVFVEQNPDLVLVYGDTNSTLAGALAAVKIHIPVAHIEAGLRSFDKKMPEEVNRILTDHVADYLFAPTHTALQNLKNEGIQRGVYHTGDVMVDVLKKGISIAKKTIDLKKIYRVEEESYYLTTIHRPSNTDNPKRLFTILDELDKLGKIIIFAVHPRTKKCMADNQINKNQFHNIVFIEPQPYLSLIRLLDSSCAVFTDSGGIQKEAYVLQKPCFTLRDTTEWVETVDSGWNKLIGNDISHLSSLVNNFNYPEEHIPFYGNGDASKEISNIIKEFT